MHVALVIGGGLVMLGLFLLFGWLWGASATAMGLAARGFVPIWAIMAVVNMWVGVTRAGYTVREELPILAIVFTAPTAIALIAAWRLTR